MSAVTFAATLQQNGKTAETRQRRIDKSLGLLRAGKAR